MRPLHARVEAQAGEKREVEPRRREPGTGDGHEMGDLDRSDARGVEGLSSRLASERADRLLVMLHPLAGRVRGEPSGLAATSRRSRSATCRLRTPERR